MERIALVTSPLWRLKVNKYTSFALVVLLFLLLSILVFFGFFIFSPEVKAYRSLGITLDQKRESVLQQEALYEKRYSTLQALQEEEKSFDNALDRHFELTDFERYLKQYFHVFEIESIITEQSDHLQTDIIEIRAVMDTPATYYRFIEALNAFEWIAEVEGRQQFKRVKSGLQAQVTLKVYTRIRP